MTPPIRSVAPEDQMHALGTVILAFSSDPLLRWFYPRSGDYVAHAETMMRAFGGRAFEHDTAFATPAFEAVSLWLPPGVHVDLDAFHHAFETTLRDEIGADVGRLGEQIEHFHIKEPHWYLPVIGVEPLHHGQGLGGALLADTLARCDAEGLPAYLESSNPRNLSLYQRHGFEAIGEIQAGSSPVVTPMRRAARRG